MSNFYRTGATQILQSIRAAVGDQSLVMGNAGSYPELALAPYLNGYTFECVNGSWNAPYLSSGFSEPSWRSVLNDYFDAQARTRTPHTNILEGCGRHQGFTPTAADIRDERMLTGTTLLSDGFSEYDLFDARSAPYWFDEYSVDGTGTAVEDLRYKGYLGNALGPAVELQSPASPVWTESFESSSLPTTLTPSNAATAFISHTPGEVITGSGSLVLNVPSHTSTSEADAWTVPNQVPMSGEHTYVIEFDWRILETLDDHVQIDVYNSNGGAGSYAIYNSILAGDSGKAHYPVTTPSGAGYQIAFRLINGGKVAIDNVWVTDGGAGPWRRDFEYGMVIVNPLNRPYTFTATELAGPYHKTGIKRIRGTQDPTINSGQAVTGSFTIGPADAIILLSDPPPATLSGRVVGADGRALRNVQVTLRNAQGNTRSALTSSFGLYSFDSVATGQTYTLSVISRLWRFASESVLVVGDRNDLDFFGLE